MNWLYYLLEANLYLAVFYGLYRLMLHKETFYNLNRYYLIFTTLLSFALPLLQVGYLKLILGQDRNLADTTTTLSPSGTNGDSLFSLNHLLPTVYLIVSLGFVLKLAYSIYGMARIAKSAKRRKQNGIIYVELSSSLSAFSFFNFLFINPVIEKKDAILKHEMVHISQRHSLDILLFEIVQICNWFNPITWLMKKDIKLQHEYIADEITTNSSIQKHEYALFLIQNSFGHMPSQLSNQFFNQSILKMRINMLNKRKSAGKARLRLLFVIPVLGGMLCVSTLAFSKDYTTFDLYASANGVSKPSVQDTLKKKSIAKSPRPVPPPPPAEPKNLKQGKVKFPPPIVVSHKFHSSPPPPPIEPPAPKVKKIKAPKVETIKFPPPIVKKDKVMRTETPPPPPVEPTKKTE